MTIDDTSLSLSCELLPAQLSDRPESVEDLTDFFTEVYWTLGDDQMAKKRESLRKFITEHYL